MHVIKSVKTSLEILDCFTSETPAIGVTEISRKLRISKSTVSRILSTLEQGGLVAKIPANQKHRLGAKILQLAGTFLSTIEWRVIAMPHVKALRDETNETVMLFMIDGDHRICLEGCESAQELRSSFAIGGQYPLHAGSAGKLLLAYLPQDEQKRILARAGLPGYTSHTITGAGELERELAEIRGKGYAVSHQERAAFLSSVSAPIRDFRGEIVAALCVYGPSVRFTPARVREFTRLALDAAKKISAEIGLGRERGPERNLRRSSRAG
jgi:DNA-binding IclR family transcriptional regulator